MCIVLKSMWSQFSYYNYRLENKKSVSVQQVSGAAEKIIDLKNQMKNKYFYFFRSGIPNFQLL